MTRILTVTLNPTIDVATEANHVQHTHKVRVDNECYDPGGGGINVARVVHELGGDALALFLSGGVTGELLCELMDHQQVNYECLPIENRTRLCFAVRDRGTNEEYRFVPAGPTISEDEVQRCLDYLAQDNTPYVVISGSEPPGAPHDMIAQIADAVNARGGKVILDSSGEPLKITLERSKVYLVKPSDGELSSLVGRKLTREELPDAALELITRGSAEIVAVTMGEEGGLLVTKNGHRFYETPKVETISAVGAGDSFVGAMTLALSEGRSPEEAMLNGVCAGAATAMRPGTELCHATDVAHLLEQTSVAA